MKLFVAAVAFLAAVGLPDVEGLSIIGKIKSKFGRHTEVTIGMPPLPQPDEDAGADEDMNKIFEQNEEWIANQKAADPEFFDKLGSGHKPNYFWIGCADARVPANELMGEPAGSVFVARNIANMVVNTDNNLLSALQYAIAYLKVPHIIVCGHYECGGVRAAVTRYDHQAPLDSWLRNIRDVYRIHRRELDAIKDPEKRHQRLVELNVREQCINVYKTGVVQEMRFVTKKTGGPYPYPTPCVHGVVFDPKVGLLQRVDVDFDELKKDIAGIYDLYGDYDEAVAGMTTRVKPVVAAPAVQVITPDDSTIW